MEGVPRVPTPHVRIAASNVPTIEKLVNWRNMKKTNRPYHYHLELKEAELWEAIERVKSRARTGKRGFLSKREIIERAIRNDRSIQRELREMGLRL